MEDKSERDSYSRAEASVPEGEQDAEQGGSRSVSDAKLAANRANAQRSTGPRTDEGKRTSSKNAMSTGVFGGVTAVPRGEFAENQEDVDAFVQGIVESFQPRDDLEYATAERVAKVYVRLDRLARLETAAFSSATRVSRGDTPDEGQSSWALHLFDTIGDFLYEDPAVPTPETAYSRPDYPRVAMLLRAVWGLDFTTVPGAWDHAQEPTTEEQWRKVAVVLRRRFKADDSGQREREFEDAEFKVRQEHEEAVGRALEFAANRVLGGGVLERSTLIESRFGRELDRMLAQMRALKERLL
jgi:hypothetical protein